MSTAENYRSEVWGEKEWPEEDDLSRQFPGRPEHPFKQGRYEGLDDFWQEMTALGDPFQYATIGRKVYQGEDHASVVGFYFPGDQLEFYEVGETLEGSVDISLMKEEGHQHGFSTGVKQYDELPSWIQELIELEDDLYWREWDGNV